jgi:hypothetical protein
MTHPDTMTPKQHFEALLKAQREYLDDETEENLVKDCFKKDKDGLPCL